MSHAKHSDAERLLLEHADGAQADRVLILLIRCQRKKHRATVQSNCSADRHWDGGWPGGEHQEGWHFSCERETIVERQVHFQSLPFVNVLCVQASTQRSGPALKGVARRRQHKERQCLSPSSFSNTSKGVSL